MVQTLVSPISTCHKAPDDADESLLEPRLLEVTEPPAEPAEVGLRRPFCEAGFVRPPALDEPRLPFLTLPPSFEGKSAGIGELGTLPEPLLPPK